MGADVAAGRYDGTPPGEDEIAARMRAEGLSPHGWGNGPGDTYGWHEHGYEKVLYCVRGQIVFHTAGSVRAYLEQIFAGLRDAGLDVFHVVLDAGEEVLRRRIRGSAEAQAWRLDYLADYLSSRAWMIQAADLAVDTGGRTPAEIAQQIAAALPEPMRTGTP